jgi:hypothetical protein
VPLFGYGQRREKFGDALHAALRLELFYLLNEMMHALGSRRDHGQSNIWAPANALDNMIGRNASNTRLAHRFSCREV